MKRFGQLIQVKPEGAAEYERLHEAVPPAVLATITACNLRNYSIFRHGDLLFAYFEYVGDDFDADMARMAADPATQAWWRLTNPLQEPLADRAAGAWWAMMREVFHTD